MFNFYRPPEVHHLFGIATWTGVLKKAAMKKRTIKDDKFVDKMDARRDETSRSESQASDNVAQLKTGNIMNPQTSVTCKYAFCFNINQRILDKQLTSILMKFTKP